MKDSDVLYPSVYYNGDKTPHEARPGMVFGAVNVSREWLEYVEKPHKPIYMYAKTTLKNVPPYYSDVSLLKLKATNVDFIGHNFEKKKNNNKYSSVYAHDPCFRLFCCR